MLRRRCRTTLNKDLTRRPSCMVCGQMRGLCLWARLCRKCIREGIAFTNYSKA